MGCIYLQIPIFLQRECFFMDFLERALQPAHPNLHMERISKYTLICSEMETLSAGLDILEKVKTLF